MRPPVRWQSSREGALKKSALVIVSSPSPCHPSPAGHLVASITNELGLEGFEEKSVKSREMEQLSSCDVVQGNTANLGLVEWVSGRSPLWSSLTGG